ncbi:MAG: SCO6745 family protein [Labedaea sp.]
MECVAARLHRILEPIHAMVNFVPELQEILTGIGLRPGRMPAFASRIAPLGAVTLGAVSGIFYTFNPELMGRFFPRAWTLASPQDIVAGRFAAVDQSLNRLLGPETIASPELAEAAALAREAAEGCFAVGRPMYAAQEALGWPEKPHVALWHATTLLREFRGDGHVAVLTSKGIDPMTALITDTATGAGFAEPAAKMLRGWSEEQWTDGVAQVQAAGLLDAGGKLTARGVELREELEEATNRLAERPWTTLGADKAERLLDLARGFAKQIVAGGAFPDGIFAAPAFTGR